MPQLEYFIVAESFSVDRYTNRVSVFNIAEELEVEQFPAPIPLLVAITAWNAEEADIDEEFQAVLRVIVPGEEQPHEVRTNFTMTHRRHRTFQGLHGIQVGQRGELRLEILLNGEHRASHSVTVRSPDGE